MAINNDKKQISSRNFKRAYFVTSDYYDEFMGIAIIATSLKEAKSKVDFDEFISIKAKWIRKDVSHLPFGEVELKTGLLNGLYGFGEEECDECHEEYVMTEENVIGDKLLCEECQEKNKMAKKKDLEKTNHEL